jgi:hypothetical protein
MLNLAVRKVTARLYKVKEGAQADDNTDSILAVGPKRQVIGRWKTLTVRIN